MNNNLREITVGRDRRCDIYLDAACQYASKMHGTIYYDGSELMFRDASTNGTYINNVMVHNRAVPIRRGDTIMIAGQYPLSWAQIDSFFPPSDRPLNPVPAAPHAPSVPTPAVPSAEQPNLGKWNWGAFFLGGIWGFFNGCWWIFLVYLGIYLCCMVPILNLFAGIGSIVFWIMTGVKGTEWAWNNRTWDSVEDFERTQHSWAVAGVCIFCLNILVSIIVGLVAASTIVTLFS
jgi:hypothetical protein